MLVAAVLYYLLTLVDIRTLLPLKIKKSLKIKHQTPPKKEYENRGVVTVIDVVDVAVDEQQQQQQQTHTTGT